MRCEYVVTYQDFVQSMKAYRKISTRAAIGYYLYVWGLPMVGLAIALICLLAFLRHDKELYDSLFWAACIGLGVAWGIPVRYRICLRRAYKQRNVLAQNMPMFCEFDDATVRFIVPAGTEISYPWESFTDYFEDDHVAVLFVQQAAFHTIPKRAMGEDGWVQFRQLANRHARNN
jgi:hypothetical protein